MRIIHLVLGETGVQTTNGVAKVAHQLASVQTKQAHNVCLWRISKSLKDDYLSRNYKTRLFLKQNNPFNLDPEVYDAVSSLESCDIVHFHGSFIPEFFQISSLLHTQSIPYVITTHGEMSPGAVNVQKWWKLPYYYLIERRIINNARAVHVLGASVKSKLVNMGCKSPVVVIPNGQDINEVARFDNISLNGFTISFCGGIDIYKKGLDISLHGFKQFLESGGEGIFEIIGTGNDLGKLQQLVYDLGLEENVRLHGALAANQKFKILSKSDIALRTSRTDGFPITILEACAMGIPSIVSKATNTADYLKKYKCGFVLRKNKAKSVARLLHKVSKLSQQGKLLEHGLNARAMVQNVFSWGEISSRVVDLYLNSRKDKARDLSLSY